MWYDQLKDIDTIVLDVDGVLTDGKLICTPEGEIWRNMQAKDGYAIQSWLKSGHKLVIITNGGKHGVLKKLEHFGVSLIFHDVRDKGKVLLEFAEANKVDLQKTLFIGDDIPDYTAMKLCGISCCPADAMSEIKAISTYISPIKGGKGCVREVIEKVLRIQDKWFQPNGNENLTLLSENG